MSGDAWSRLCPPSLNPLQVQSPVGMDGGKEALSLLTMHSVLPLLLLSKGRDGVGGRNLEGKRAEGTTLAGGGVHLSALLLPNSVTSHAADQSPRSSRAGPWKAGLSHTGAQRTGLRKSPTASDPPQEHPGGWQLAQEPHSHPAWGLTHFTSHLVMKAGLHKPRVCGRVWHLGKGRRVNTVSTECLVSLSLVMLLLNVAAWDVYFPPPPGTPRHKAMTHPVSGHTCSSWAASVAGRQGTRGSGIAVRGLHLPGP